MGPGTVSEFVHMHGVLRETLFGVLFLVVVSVHHHLTTRWHDGHAVNTVEVYVVGRDEFQLELSVTSGFVVLKCKISR